MLWGTAGAMVLSSNLSGKFRKRRDGTTKCRPSSSFILTCRASCQKDRTGRRNVVRPRPGPRRTDCPVENTAPRCASWNGHETVVKMLLGRGDVNPDKPSNDDLTALWGTTNRGHAGVIAILGSPISATHNRP